MTDNGLKRIGNEQFYTNETISMDLTNKFNDIFKLDSFDTIIEPAAGTGSFIKSILKFKPKELKCYDIDPKHTLIKKQDYLLLDTSIFNNKKVLVISNPPFGIGSCLAKKFIEQSSKFASVIAFILPKSFKKQSKSIYFPLNFHCVYIIDLPDNSFILNDKPYNVPCVFVIYEKRNYNRTILPKIFPNENYIFIKKNEITNYNNKFVVGFKRVGGCAGKFVFNNLSELSIESHYFIVFNKKFDTSKIKFDHNNTAGPKSISKQELILQLNLNLK